MPVEKYKHIKKRHNVSLLLYHIVLVAKYRRSVFSNNIDKVVIEICDELELKYEIQFHEIWSDDNHVHFLVQSVPVNSPQKIVQIMKSIIAKEVFKRAPEVKQWLRWWEFWTDWYYVNTVWWFGSIDMIEKYIKNQGNNTKNYKQMYRKQKIENLFWEQIYV